MGTGNGGRQLQRGFTWHGRYIPTVVSGTSSDGALLRALDALDLPITSSRSSASPERITLRYRGAKGIQEVRIRALVGRGQDWPFQHKAGVFYIDHKPHIQNNAQQPIDLLITVIPKEGVPTTVKIRRVTPIKLVTSITSARPVAR